MIEDFAEGETEDGDGGVGHFELVLEVALVEDVPFSVLNEEEDTTLLGGAGLGVGFKGCAKSLCKTLRTRVFRQVLGIYRALRTCIAHSC